ncbi:copper homeostasis protein CutC [Anaerotalea alkaliphila]|uniref:PF03932 family protein CutC n=1 Tax=Anaerotalea alkaliphila TaxID=2662126 RepID=A0A7X5KMS3_9FIRM|nr:copper homeostasis protein CutC [Anaerotalea alkaliphila]NDL68266.1 copper homeostasis protein CutC [Anaerotalea alkaliphila]
MCIREACVGSWREAEKAQEAGADRIELCAGLQEGGTTPSKGTIRMAKSRLKIPVVVMIRPRGGGFVYTPEEREIMEMDILEAKEAGAEGVAFGILDQEGKISREDMKRLISAAKPMEVVFHMAFDELEDPLAAMETLIGLGVDRILTKGSKTSAMDGRDTLKALVEAAAGRMQILPGGGVDRHNYREIIARTGATQVHGTRIV